MKALEGEMKEKALLCDCRIISSSTVMTMLTCKVGIVGNEMKASEHSLAEKPSKYLIIFNCFRNNFVQLAISLKRAAVVWQQIELNGNIFL